MPHLHRFYAAPESVAGETAILTQDEAHHALHVVRVRQGDTVEVFDGLGRSWQGEIATASRREVTVALHNERHEPRPATQLTLLQAWLHRDRSIEDLIRRCTEVGVSRFVFFPAARSELKPRPSTKWDRIAVETCKQCGRLWVPEFEVAESLDRAFAAQSGPAVVATKDAPPVSLVRAVKGNALAVLVGPEGDWTAEELDAAQARGAMPVSLGDTTFRSEAASALLCALVQYEWGRLGPRA